MPLDLKLLATTHQKALEATLLKNPVTRSSYLSLCQAIERGKSRAKIQELSNRVWQDMYDVGIIRDKQGIQLIKSSGVVREKPVKLTELLRKWFL